MFIFFIFKTRSCKDTEVIAEECFAKRDQPKLNSLDVEEKKSNLYTYFFLLHPVYYSPVYYSVYSVYSAYSVYYSVWYIIVQYIIQTRYIQFKSCGPQSVSLIIDQGKYLESLCLRWWTTLSRPPSLTSPLLSWSVTTSYTLSLTTSSIQNHDCDPCSSCKLKVLPNNLFPNLPSLVWLDVRYFVAHIEKICSVWSFLLIFRDNLLITFPLTLRRSQKLKVAHSTPVFDQFNQLIVMFTLANISYIND